MDRKLVGTILLVLASGGCRMCSNCCDDLPPVLDGQQLPSGMRSGSAFGGAIVPTLNEVDEADEISLLEVNETPATENS